MSTSISLAVLPLQVLSDEPRAAIFCQGLVMDLITDLARFRPFQIISYDTSQALNPDEAPDSGALDDLRLDYLVKGMARSQGEELHLNLQLVNVPQNRLVWAEKFNGGFDELFHIQEEIVDKVVGSLQSFVDYDRMSELRKKPLVNLNAYECWLRGYRELKRGTLEADEKARDFFRQAMELDPHYARAHTGMSLSFFNEWSCQLWSRWDVSQSGAFEWARKALELDEWDHVSHGILGRIYLFKGEYEKAEHHLRRSLRINPNDADALVLVASSFVYLGYLDEALRYYQRARRLNPSDDDVLVCGALVHFERGEFEEAIALSDRYGMERAFVDFPAYMAAAHFSLGDHDAMRSCWQVYMKQFVERINGGEPADAQTALRWMINVNPFRGETKLRPFWEHLGGLDPDELRVERPDAAAAAGDRFAREGELWVLSFGGVRARLPDLKGCHDLARLLAHPRKPVHCTDLMGAQVTEEGEAVFDEKARAAYQARVRELQEEMEEAAAAQDVERAAGLREEYELLLEHLAQAAGVGGRTRRAGGTVEKCRSAVTWRIRSAIKRIAEVHPALARHLEASVKTGVFCEYAPEREIDWTT